jgi:hypothetical protein
VAGDSRTVTVTIPNGGTTSTLVNATAFSQFSLFLPAAFTGTALTFQVSPDGQAGWVGLRALDGTAKTALAVAAGQAYPCPDELRYFPYFRVVSGTAEGAARTLTVWCKEL